MSPEIFNKIVQTRCNQINSVLANKAVEYAPGADRLNNFRRAAEIQHISMEQAALNFFMKHLVSIQDMVEASHSYPLATWDEKLGDAINYLILLEAIVKEPEFDDD